jgi:predicted DNA-binding protein
MAKVEGTDEQTMILRTVYLPPEMDRRLREIAYKLQVTKNEMIRRMIGAGLTAHDAASSVAPTITRVAPLPPAVAVAASTPPPVRRSKSNAPESATDEVG